MQSYRCLATKLFSSFFLHLKHQFSSFSSSSLSKRFIAMTSSSHTQKTLIGTHSGQFHCDDALACFLIKQLKPYRNSEIIRTRDAEELEKCEIVVDVGFVYDHTLKRYDHHQKTFNLQLKDILPHKTFGNIKLSSAGLIYAHYGHEIIAEILMSNSSDSNIDAVFDYVYENFIKEIDAIDNG